MIADLSQLEPGAAIVDRETILDRQREEWFQKRAGLFTCSRFGDLTKPGRGKDEPWSQTAWTYMYQVAAERCGSYQFEHSSAPTRHGVEFEPQAITEYHVKHPPNGKCISGVDAWCQLNAFTGGTPDALLGEDGCLEVKCPYTPQEHMRYVHEGKVPDKYHWQVIGHLLVSQRQWCDFVSFDPRIHGPGRMLVVRTNRSDVETQIEWLLQRLVAANIVVQDIVEAAERC